MVKDKETYSSLQTGLWSPLREITCHMGSQTVLPATRRRWHSRLYHSRSWYSIYRPRRDARL